MNNEINYDILIESEDKLIKEFQEFVKHSVIVHKEIWKILFKESESPKDYEYIKSLEEESNFMQKNMLDDAIWTISKDQPRANHLRYIIALIYSTKDIERSIDTAFEIFRTTKYTKEYKFKDFKDIVKLFLDLITKLEPLIGSNYKENVEKVKAEKIKFNESFYKYVGEISHNLKHEGVSSKFAYQCSSICKNISLATVHYLNSFSNFKYIKSSSSRTKRL